MSMTRSFRLDDESAKSLSELPPGTANGLVNNLIRAAFHDPAVWARATRGDSKLAHVKMPKSVRAALPVAQKPAAPAPASPPAPVEKPVDAVDKGYSVLDNILPG